nr:MAG TPA: hypothetical protein [Caudoviricetes sp.]
MYVQATYRLLQTKKPPLLSQQRRLSRFFTHNLLMNIIKTFLIPLYYLHNN